MGDPIACDLSEGLTEICRKTCICFNKSKKAHVWTNCVSI